MAVSKLATWSTANSSTQLHERAATLRWPSAEDSPNDPPEGQ